MSGPQAGESKAFVAIECVYSMDGTLAPLHAMFDTMDEVSPTHNAHFIVDKAHTTGYVDLATVECPRCLG